MPAIVKDVFEPAEMTPLLERWALTVYPQNMVPMGLADYFWIGFDSLRYTLERKQGRELISNMGNRLDEQLRKHQQNADVVILGVQGIITPKEGGGCNFWDNKPREGSKVPAKVFYKTGSSPKGYEAVQAYLFSLAQQGIQVFQWPDMPSMAMGIASFVHNSMKPEHTTLAHHVKHRPNLFKPNAYIETLMGIGGDTRIGEKLAKRIVEECITPYSFFNSDLDRMGPIIGDDTFRRAMKNIGRSRY